MLKKILNSPKKHVLSSKDQKTSIYGHALHTYKVPALDNGRNLPHLISRLKLSHCKFCQDILLRRILSYCKKKSVNTMGILVIQKHVQDSINNQYNQLQFNEELGHET